MPKTVLALAFLTTCASPATEPPIVQALLRGDQETVDQFTAAFLEEETRIFPSWLGDYRRLPPVLLRVDAEEHYFQYGVALVADYFLCLLEIKDGTSTRELLGAAMADFPCPSEDACEVCNSSTDPLDPQLRGLLQEYWRRHL